MRINLHNGIEHAMLPVRRRVARISTLLFDEAEGEERLITAAAVALGVLVVVAFALLMATV